MAGERGRPAQTAGWRQGRTLGTGKACRRGGAQTPRYWVNIAHALGKGGAVKAGRLNGWLLVLAAKRIPHIFSPGSIPRLSVPPLCEGVALYEIAAFENERTESPSAQPGYDNAWAVVLVLCALAAWHGLRFGWFQIALPSPPFPSAASDWPAAFGLDVYRTRVLHQWWRTATALCLHSDDGHLAANVGFGLVFLTPLFRRVGSGMGLALTVLAGVCGNVGNALSREANVVSLGFSTALFGAVGALCAVTASPTRALGGIMPDRLTAFARKVVPPVGAGLALLGLLGGGGEPRTDYAAHIWGFGAGVLLGCMVGPLEGRLSAYGKQVQVIAFSAVLLGLLMAWWTAVCV